MGGGRREAEKFKMLPWSNQILDIILIIVTIMIIIITIMIMIIMITTFP